jgi:hypothetical protein
MTVVAATEFFTTHSVLTFAGASGATLIVTNTIRKLTRLESAWVPFVVALILAFVIAASTDALGGVLDGVVALLNACLLFCTALGLQEGAVAAKTPAEEGRPTRQSGRTVPWLSPWLRR